MIETEYEFWDGDKYVARVQRSRHFKGSFKGCVTLYKGKKFQYTEYAKPHRKTHAEAWKDALALLQDLLTPYRI